MPSGEFEQLFEAQSKQAGYLEERDEAKDEMPGWGISRHYLSFVG